MSVKYSKPQHSEEGSEANNLARILAIVGVLAAVWFVRERLQTPRTIIVLPNGQEVHQPYVHPRDGREQWAIDLARALGNEEPSGGVIAFLVAWSMAEDRGSGAMDRNNPWNTTYENDAVTMVINHDGVKGYATHEAGVEATANTLYTNHRGYADIVAGIRDDRPDTALAGLYASPWGTNADTVRTVLDNIEGDYTEAYASPAGTRRPTTAEMDTRGQLVAMALTQLGKPYRLGAKGPDEYDCSGLVKWSYARVLNVDVGDSTFDQLPQLRAIEPEEVQVGDLIYFQFPSDQHVGILADVDADGRWDMIQAGGYLTANDVNVLYDIFGSHPTFTDAIIGYRSVL